MNDHQNEALSNEKRAILQRLDFCIAKFDLKRDEVEKFQEG